MDNLPQEIIDRICDFLGRFDLRNTVTLSRRFQYSSERASEAWTYLHLTEQDAGMFMSCYTGWRWKLLRRVEFRTYISPYEGDQRCDLTKEPQSNYCRESEEELNEKNLSFTGQIMLLFEILQTVESKNGPGNIQLTIYTPVRRTSEETCPHRKCPSWRLRLLNPQALHSLSSVHTLNLEDEEMIFPLEQPLSLLKVDLRILVDLIVKLPQLELLGCRINAGGGWTTDRCSDPARHYTKDWGGPLHDSRNGFSNALEGVSVPTSLRCANLDFMWPLSDCERIDQTMPLPNLVGAARFDPFSSSLRLLCHRMKKLQITAMIDGTLFWPTDSAASWPNLEHFHVLFHMATPSGGWYFKGPKDSESNITKATEVTACAYPPLFDTADDESWDDLASDYGLELVTKTCKKFRIRPHEEKLRPFLESFAKATSQMSMLKTANVWCPLKWDASDIPEYEDFDPGLELEAVSESSSTCTAWAILYMGKIEGGDNPFPGAEAAIPGVRQLWWATGSWRPDHELHGLFKGIGDQNVPLAEYWPDDDNYHLSGIRRRLGSYNLVETHNL